MCAILDNTTLFKLSFLGDGVRTEDQVYFFFFDCLLPKCIFFLVILLCFFSKKSRLAIDKSQLSTDLQMVKRYTQMNLLKKICPRKIIENLSFGNQMLQMSKNKLKNAKDVPI